MCGGPSQVMTSQLSLSSDVESRLTNHGLSTAQAIIDEGVPGLVIIGLSETDIAGVKEAIHQETGEWID